MLIMGQGKLCPTCVFDDSSVYAVEFVVYRKIIKEISFKRILVYTIVANTASLLVGILVGNIINV